MPEEKGGDFEQLGFDPSTFATLEADFEETLDELSEPHLDSFKAEYETLHRALKKSHESEKRLLKKCRELSTDITATNTKVSTAERLSGEDQNVVAQLKKDIEKIWSSVEHSHEKEAQSKDTLGTLRAEIENLRHSIDQGAGTSIVQENRVRELGAERDELHRERDSHAQQVQQARGEIVEISERLKVLEAEKAVTDTAVAELAGQVETKRAETERERRRKERLERELKELKEVLERRQGDIKAKQARAASPRGSTHRRPTHPGGTSLCPHPRPGPGGFPYQSLAAPQRRVRECGVRCGQARVATGLEDQTKLEQQLREQKQHTDRTLKEVDGLTQKVSRLQAELEDQVSLRG